MTQAHPHYIAGAWTPGALNALNLNPSDLDTPVGEYAQADQAQALTALQAAVQAAPAWGMSGVQARADMLDQIGTEILARRDELGRLLASEEGKVLAEAVGEVTRAGHIFKFFAGEALRLPGEKLASVRPGVECEITREPVGVVGIITPWNFPIAIPAWKIAPALAWGNTVLFKPAELVPGCAWALADIIVRALPKNAPAGTFNLVMGRGSVVGQAWIGSGRLDALSFTGSAATGQRLARQCMEHGEHLPKLQLEMGGKNPLVVLDDADLRVAVDCAVNGAYFSTGQRCTASSRLIVTDGIHDRFVSALLERLRALQVGHALEASTQIGPVVDATQLAQDLDYIRIGREEGAQLAWGGEPLTRTTRGHFLSPALFTETQASMRINREEIFGPVASVLRARDYEHALALANDTPYGLSSGIVTTSLKHASHFKRAAQAGMVMVNLPTAGVDYHVPFGGRKASSHGPREQGHYAAEFYTTVKTAYVMG